jgi:LemA protein
MGVGLVILIIVLVLVVIAIGIVVGMYNGLVRLRNAVKNAWAQIDVQLKRRYDLIPNLVETVKGYKNFERETLEAVTKARNIALQASSSGAGAAERGKAEGELSGALARLMVVVERYPELKANQNFLALQEELTST